METASGDDAILIEMEAGFYNKAEYNNANCSNEPDAGGGNLCHYCFDDGAASLSPDSVEYGYFDRLHKQIEDDYCVDTTRQFFAGYSSGGWMAHQLGCQFPDVLRAQASVTGGLPPVIRDGVKTCVDHPIAAFLIHDVQRPVEHLPGIGRRARAACSQLNGCAAAPRWDGADRAVHDHRRPQQRRLQLRRYTGCPAAVPDRLLHVAQDKQHNAQTTAAVPGFWEFFESL